MQDWQDYGFDKPLLVNMQPAGEFLGESFHRAGGIPAVMGELMKAGMLTRRLHDRHRQDHGREHRQAAAAEDHAVIKTVAEPMREHAGFIVVKGNLFDSAVMKTSVISKDFRDRFLSDPGEENIHTARAVVFEGPEHYHAAINEPELQIDANCDAVHPRRRLRRLSGLGRGGEHAAAGRAAEAGHQRICRRSATAGSRAPRKARRS